MFAEITASITLNSNCTITAKVFDTLDSSDTSKQDQMRNALKTLVQGNMVTSPLSVHSQGKTSSESDKLISQKQIGIARKLLRENKIEEADFCRAHSVESLEKMPKEEARQAIGELIDSIKTNH